MKKLLSEPFVQFVILGGLLFAGHAIWQAKVTKADRTIIVSAAEMERQAAIFAGENRRQPTDSDLEALLFAHVEEQVLMREAKRMGLDEDDTIIRRRLAQKMRFMIEDIGAPALPKTDALRAWYADNPDMFRRAPTRSFEHIYLSPQQRGGNVMTEAQALLDAGVGDNWEELGDAFMTGRNFADMAPDAVKREFGTAFMDKLFALPATGPQGDWQGPAASAFGAHLVRVTSETAGFVPEFDDIAIEVETAWLDAAQRTANAERLRKMIESYKIEVEE